VLIQACLNGPRNQDEHPALPIGREELARDAAACVAAGAGAIHMHPRDEGGQETLSAEVVDAAALAVREACGRAVGVATGAWIEPDVERRVALIGEWREPDYASVNLSEPGAAEVIETLLARGIGVEAGIWSVADVERLRATGAAARLTRVLVEVVEGQAEPAAEARRIDQALDLLAACAPRLHHGEDATAWPVLTQALELGRDTRVGLEDTLLLPDGERARDNADLVATVSRLAAGGRDPRSRT
jgi:uncharacterized protein (DUF849 family)